MCTMAGPLASAAPRTSSAPGWVTFGRGSVLHPTPVRRSEVARPIVLKFMAEAPVLSVVVVVFVRIGATARRGPAREWAESGPISGARADRTSDRSFDRPTIRSGRATPEPHRNGELRDVGCGRPG